jgi:ribosomal-protein-alanine N-acetyltransferase
MEAVHTFPILSTKHLLLTALVAEDAAAISLLRSDERVNKYIDRPKNCSIEDAQAFIQKIKANYIHQKGVYWTIRLHDKPELIGTICLWNYSESNPRGEIGYELNPKYHGKGIMDEAVKCVLHFGFETLQLKVIDAYTHFENNSSINLLLKNKFTFSENIKDEEYPNNVIYTLHA